MASRRRKAEGPPDEPGEACPDCGQERKRPVSHGPFPSMHPPWVDRPHEDPRDCVRFLRSELQSLRDDLRSTEREVERIDAPRIREC